MNAKGDAQALSDLMRTLSNRALKLASTSYHPPFTAWR